MWIEATFLHFMFSFSFFLFFLEERLCFFSGSHVLFTGLTNLFFFNKTLIKNGSHGTIHTFKNYFATVFSVFSKISSIQTYPKSKIKYTSPKKLAQLLRILYPNLRLSICATFDPQL